MKNFVINQELSYYDIQKYLINAGIFYYIDKYKNIVLLENNNKTLIHPHKMYISKNLSLYIDRYCSFDIYKILTVLLKLYAINVLDFCNLGNFYE